jgi:hypothetical protein
VSGAGAAHRFIDEVLGHLSQFAVSAWLIARSCANATLTGRDGQPATI